MTLDLDALKDTSERDHLKGRIAELEEADRRSTALIAGLDGLLQNERDCTAALKAELDHLRTDQEHCPIRIRHNYHRYYHSANVLENDKNRGSARAGKWSPISHLRLTIMSTNKDRIDLATAQAVAGEVREMLALFCHRIEIAGSVRRQSPTVGDIELLAEPKTSERFTDFFSQIMEIENHLDGYLRTLLDQGTLAPRLDGNGRSALGPRYKRLLYRGFPFDLFSCIPPAQWGLLLAIRTGPGEFSHQLVTPRHMGGLLPDGYSVREGQLWHGFESVPVHDEQTLFGILGMDYIPPADRREDWTR